MGYPSASKQVELTYPVNIDGKDYKTLDIRRPKVRDNMIADKQNQNDADKEIHLMALLASVERQVIEELDMIDFSKLQQVILGFHKSAADSANETSSAE